MESFYIEMISGTRWYFLALACAIPAVMLLGSQSDYRHTGIPMYSLLLVFGLGITLIGIEGTASNKLEEMAGAPTDHIDAEGVTICEATICALQATVELTDGRRFPVSLGDHGGVFLDRQSVTVGRLQTPSRHYTVPALCRGDQCVVIQSPARGTEAPICEVSGAHRCLERAELRELRKGGLL